MMWRSLYHIVAWIVIVVAWSVMGLVLFNRASANEVAYDPIYISDLHAFDGDPYIICARITRPSYKPGDEWTSALKYHTIEYDESRR